ncbi:hypothetical protein L9F63_022985, partial [Diploptera punctata]
NKTVPSTLTTIIWPNIQLFSNFLVVMKVDNGPAASWAWANYSRQVWLNRVDHCLCLALNFIFERMGKDRMAEPNFLVVMKVDNGPAASWAWGNRKLPPWPCSSSTVVIFRWRGADHGGSIGVSGAQSQEKYPTLSIHLKIKLKAQH